MRFMVMVKMREDIEAAPPALSAEMGREMGEQFAAGTIVDAGSLFPMGQSTEIRVAKGQLSVTDGPFAEAKEVAGGYSILQVGSRDEATRLARRVAELHQEFWPGWEGSIELRQIAEPTG